MNKLNDAYKSISEVAEILNLKDKKTGKLNTHTIRFWEKKFKQIKPKFFNSNRRYYDKNSIEILIKIQYLLKVEGMTILGAKKLLNNKKKFDLDDSNNKTINHLNNNLYLKLNKISKIIKEIKDI
tara:strand:- start:52 stop:426 length:375 start_codon:yes stop_codon:yes gene_type:complete